MKVATWVVVVVMSAALSSCSTVGPGLAHHPLDCAMGVKWADCKPGTPGYNNGGGQQTRAEEQASRNVALKSDMDALSAQCKASYEIAELDLIRGKVEFYRESLEASPPFEIATNDTFPSRDELPAIGKWAKLREQCMRNDADALARHTFTGPETTAATWALLKSMRRDADGRISELAVALYQQRLTYGEFAQKRYEIYRDEQMQERRVIQNATLADRQAQLQADEIAQRERQASMAAWSAYTQSVLARPPQTVLIQQAPPSRTQCTSTRTGDTINTYCN